MRVFLLEPVRTEAEIEAMLACEPRFVDLPCGACPMIWMPKATWDAFAFVLDQGYAVYHSRYPVFFTLSAYDFDRLTSIDATRMEVVTETPGTDSDE